MTINELKESVTEAMLWHGRYGIDNQGRAFEYDTEPLPKCRQKLGVDKMCALR